MSNRRDDINDKSRNYLYQSIQVASETEGLSCATIEILQSQGETLAAAAEQVREIYPFGAACRIVGV